MTFVVQEHLFGPVQYVLNHIAGLKGLLIGAIIFYDRNEMTSQNVRIIAQFLSYHNLE